MTELSELYRREINQIENEINVIKRIDILNSKLHKYNWIFFHPYNQGIEIEYFENLVLSLDDNTEKRIFEIYARKFLNLSQTIGMIEGFYRKRPFLNDFITQIEESVILCIQKDFSGAISLLLPVIEGSLRNYLISKKGDKAKHIIKMSELTSKAFNEMLNDYLSLIDEGLNTANNQFDINQKKQILRKYKEYFSLWIKQLSNYLNNNLYLDTRTDEINDSFNRHILIHALDKIDYSFKNYLRLFNCLNYLTWAFGNITKGCSALADVEEEVIRKKWVEYFKIMTISETLTEIKSNIYRYEIDSFKKYIDKPLIEILAISEILHKQLLKVNEVLVKTKK